MQGLPIRQRLEAASPGTTVEIDPTEDGGEIEGPFLINKPLIVEGHGVTLWARKGPVLRIVANGPVELRNLAVEVTGEDAAGREAMAIEVVNTDVRTAHVRVKGKVSGLADAGVWRFPPTISLRAAAGSVISVELVSAVPAKARWNIAGLESGTSDLQPGPNNLRLQVSADAVPRSRILGHVDILDRADDPLFTIPVVGWVRARQAVKTGHPSWPRRLTTAVTILVLMAFTGAGLYAGWWWFAPPRVTVAPTRVSLGTLTYAPGEGVVRHAYLLEARWSTVPRQVALTADLSFQVYDPFGNTVAVRQARETVVLTNRCTPLGIVQCVFPISGLTTQELDFDGEILFSCNAKDARIEPQRLPFHAAIRPAAQPTVTYPKGIMP